ncbi:MAG: helix-turn-helix transcriptional regulator [Bacteroidales bacterium]|nr:helix-turn-helix transcriptional regulator [Bacteroidales bacterium]
MKEKENSFEAKIVDNIRKIMTQKHLTQAAFAGFMDISESQFSKILSGKHHMSFLYLEKLASALSMREIDIITYPQCLMEEVKREEEPVEAILQIKLKKDKKDQVLKLVFGENDIEILNK